MKETVCEALLMVTFSESSGAAKYVSSPACEAMTVQVPPVSVVTVPTALLAMEQAELDEASIEYETGRPLEAVALTLKLPPLDHVGVGAAPNVIVWLERASTVWRDESVEPESFVARTTKV